MKFNVPRPTFIREHLDNIESFDKIYNHRCLNWFVKLTNMPATESENRPPPGNSLVLGATIVVVSAADRGKILSRTLLIWFNNLKFDDSDPILGCNNGEVSCIFALITGDNVEFNLCADHGLRELAKN